MLSFKGILNIGTQQGIFKESLQLQRNDKFLTSSSNLKFRRPFFSRRPRISSLSSAKIYDDLFKIIS